MVLSIDPSSFSEHDASSWVAFASDAAVDAEFWKYSSSSDAYALPYYDDVGY